MERLGGRPGQIDLDDIIGAGRAVGLRRLSMNAVAARLGVTSAALYRHVDGRWGLERLVGESILSEFEIADDAALDTVPALLALAMRLREFILEHPGLAEYLQTLFPRGEGGRTLLADAAEVLERRGYEPDVAVVLCAAVASVTIGFAAAEDAQASREDDLSGQRDAAYGELLDDERLGFAHRALPEIDAEEYVRLWLGAAIRGFVAAAPPGRPIAEVRAALHAAGEGR